ncbi:class III signal peptide-containing protein [Palaeococcus pacificus]|uniref:class III signal peptide-containing protein n=1 Tax=Palaeococcus pacificus TaxID=971279 RepID=UPI002E80D705|nr:class III signal peptide-containing protein [Palaeococcus pacificus]
MKTLRRAQGAIEYLFMLAAALILIAVVLRVITTSLQEITTAVTDYTEYLREKLLQTL